MKGNFNAVNNCCYIKFTPNYPGEASIADLKMQKHFSNFSLMTKRYINVRVLENLEQQFIKRICLWFIMELCSFFCFISEYQSFLEN